MSKQKWKWQAQKNGCSNTRTDWSERGTKEAPPCMQQKWNNVWRRANKRTPATETKEHLQISPLILLPLFSSWNIVLVAKSSACSFFRCFSACVSSCLLLFAHCSSLSSFSLLSLLPSSSCTFFSYYLCHFSIVVVSLHFSPQTVSSAVSSVVELSTADRRVIGSSPILRFENFCWNKC